MSPCVLLPSAIAARLAELRSRHLPLETGGFLIGVRRGPHVEVTGLTEQGPGDLATASSFERLCPSHRERIHAAWRASDRFETLVGDWHSHPVGSGDPSGTDRSAWRTLARTSRCAVFGLIAADAASPRAFVTRPIWRAAGRELRLIEEGGGALVFGAP